MLRAFLRFIIISFVSFINGLVMIFFEKDEIIGIEFYVVDQINKKEIEQNILLKHLRNCYRQVQKKDRKH